MIPSAHSSSTKSATARTRLAPKTGRISISSRGTSAANGLEMDERPRSSIQMTWSGMADKFLYHPFNRLFCSGKCTFLPEHATHAGKIIVCDFPLLEYGHETGKLINCLLKIAFQRAWLRRDTTQYPNIAFLWQDEFQYFVLPRGRDNAFQQTCRSARIAVVCITQNILNLAEELGEQTPGSKTKAFLGNLMLKIFHQQNDVDTNEYAANLIGKEYRYLRSMGIGSGMDMTAGRNEQILYKVDPDVFTTLQKPGPDQPIAEAIVYLGGTRFEATRDEHYPEGQTFLRTGFSR